jgi:hypothetical protein
MAGQLASVRLPGFCSFMATVFLISSNDHVVSQKLAIFMKLFGF